MGITELEQLLMDFNEDELFYRQYYLARQTPAELKAFLASLNLKDALERRLIIPDIKECSYQHMHDEWFFDENSKNNVVLTKHNRFTPEFWHSHIFFQFSYVLSGRCQQKIGQQTLVMEAGDFCLIAPNIKHAIAVFDESIVINIVIRRSTFNDIFFNMLCDNNIISIFFNQFLYAQKYSPFLVIATAQDQKIKKMVLEMLSEFQQKNNYYELILTNQLMILFAKLLQKYEDRIILPRYQSKNSDEISKILNFIMDNYQSVSLSIVAKQFYYSMPYCSKLIKDYTGKSFTEIVQDIKFNKAEILLKETNITVSEISQFIGFNNIENFNRLFKKRYAMTPTEFRRCMV
ncbi:AraC-type DNA-binding protein [Pasteurella testudinis DSM 23072]|uniref:AraC-type DNA-binding protein n=1 Tax=Pasteurella testudinis DSM 23072 TaxID=1122938 RepID=A0A1W1USC8_9PAST|nr:AraC family transcriptional regulator [Pasteurella testudinis]SMB84048.1 AraC-type DNA-binding protein [Pasteurella testudinis DSM 23072]SUB50920.1 xylose operon regulatory protein [Pasteurella testudinis]